MKFIWLLNLILVITSISVFSQWEVMNPSLLADKSFVVYADSTYCSVLTERGTIVISSDRGKTWKYRYPDKYMNISKAVFIDQNNGWVASGGSSFQTTDGGISWIDRGNVLEFANWDFYFKDPLNGWAVGNSFVKRTTDGGDSWITDTVDNNSNLRFISHAGDSILYTGGNHVLYKSSDNGASWKKMPDIPGYQSYYDMVWGNKDSIPVGFLLGTLSKLFITTDGGMNWEIMPQNNSSRSINKIAFYNGQFVEFSSSMIFTTTDFGNSWDSLSIPKNPYNTFYPVGNDILYLSGYADVLLASFDGCKSFTNFSTSNLVPANQVYFGNISMVDSNNGYINVGNIFKTRDGCKSFTNITPPEFPEIMGTAYGFSDKIAAVSSDISIFSTKDGGESWKVSTYGQPNTQIPLDICFRDSVNWIAGCGWNVMRISSDGGNSWTNRIFGDTSQMHISSVSFLDSVTGYFTASEQLYKTSNGGKDWYLFKEPFRGNVKFIDNLNGIETIFSNPFAYTTDGGNTWNNCEHIESVQGYDIKKNGNSSVLMCYRYDSLFISVDLGKTWQQKELLPFGNITSISMTDPSTAWFMGFYGSIVRYHNNSIPTGVSDKPEVIKDLKLFQNYPNPFNPDTKISYYIAEQLFVELKVFDMLGREIATVVNEIKSPGKYEVTFNGSNFASGVYFYRLKAGEFSETKKFVLLK